MTELRVQMILVHSIKMFNLQSGKTDCIPFACIHSSWPDWRLKGENKNVFNYRINSFCLLKWMKQTCTFHAFFVRDTFARYTANRQECQEFDAHKEILFLLMKYSLRLIGLVELTGWKIQQIENSFYFRQSTIAGNKLGIWNIVYFWFFHIQN